MASKQNWDEGPDLTSKKARIDIMESNQNNENVYLNNSIEIEVTMIKRINMLEKYCKKIT